MSEVKHTQTSWKIVDRGIFDISVVDANTGGTICHINNQGDWFPKEGGKLKGRSQNEMISHGNLMAAAPELLEALEDCIDAQWHIDFHSVKFDTTVLFSEFYDFDGVDGTFREEFLAEYECVVWPSGGKWSAYCTYEGSMWFEQFGNVRDAKEQCMKLLDIVLPEHPAMKARAVIAKARGVQP